MPNCIVCDVHAAKLYKCSNCRAFFCSAPCGKAHRGSAVCEEAMAATMTTTTQQESRKHFERPPVEQQECDARRVDDADGALKLRQCAALASNKRILNQLKSKELQRTLRIIDNSRARLEALEAAMHNIPEFREFCKEILTCIDEAA